MAANVVIFTRAGCGYCVRALELLRRKGVTFREVNAGFDPTIRGWLARASGQSTVPQVFVNGRSLGGFTDIDALDRAKKLDPLLATPPSSSDPELPL